MQENLLGFNFEKDGSMRFQTEASSKWIKYCASHKEKPTVFTEIFKKSDFLTKTVFFGRVTHCDGSVVDVVCLIVPVPVT